MARPDRMPRAVVDDDRAVRLHRDQGLSVHEIAEALGVSRPSIYRAFYRANYFAVPAYKPKNVKAPKMPPTWPRQYQGEHEPHRLRETKSDWEAEEAAIAKRRILPRDPCPRCDTRGDLPCKHRPANVISRPLGWRVG